MEHFIDDIDRAYSGADAAEKFVIGGVVFTRKEHWRTQERYGLHPRHGRRFGPGVRTGFWRQISTSFTHCGNSYLFCRHLPPFVGPNHPNQRLDSTGMVPARQHRVTLIVLIPAISGDEQNACLTLLLLALSQPHAGTPAVLVDELDPGRF